MNEFSEYNWTARDHYQVILAQTLGCIDFVRARHDRIDKDTLKEKLDESATLIVSLLHKMERDS
jgi:hypothetical protein